MAVSRAVATAPLTRRPQRQGSTSVYRLTSFVSSSNVLVALAPAALGLLLLSTLTGGASGAALCAILRAIGQKTIEQGRRMSRRLSHGLQRFTASGRRLSSEISQAALQQGLQNAHLRARQKTLGLCAAITLILLRLFYKLRVALQGFDFSVPLGMQEDKLDAKVAARLSRMSGDGLPRWGRGFPGGVPQGSWRPFLWGAKEPQELLEELSNGLGLWSSPTDITMDQLTEGVRRVILDKFGDQLRLHDGEFCTEEEAQRIALALAADCDLPMPLPVGGLEDCVQVSVSKVLPWSTPKWLVVIQRGFFPLLRLFFHTVLSFKSRFVKTPFGLLHVLDSDPDGQSPERERPPLLLQHGAFVTGWSMMLLAWFLSYHRRVVVPDLFDFEYGFSISDGKKKGRPVRDVMDHIESLVSVARDLSSSRGGQPIDIAGHSFGGFLAAVLAHTCEQKRLPVRKVVLLGPGGPPARMSGHPLMPHVFNRPLELLEESVPRWAPLSILKMVAKTNLGVLLSANNCNTLLGIPTSNYLGGGPEIGFSTKCSTLLLWGDQDNVAWPRRPRPLSNFLKANFPSLDAFWVRGSYHNLQFDGVVAVAQAMEAFLDPPEVGQGGRRSGSLLKALLWFTNRKVERMTFDTVEPADFGQWQMDIATPSVRAKL